MEEKKCCKSILKHIKDDIEFGYDSEMILSKIKNNNYSSNHIKSKHEKFHNDLIKGFENDKFESGYVSVPFIKSLEKKHGIK